MNTQLIANAIRSNTSLEYVLENTYIFDWESDIFGVSKSNFIYEIEVKLSRSDFLADFKKVNKHKILNIAHGGFESYVRRLRTVIEYDYEYTDWGANQKKIKRARYETRKSEISEYYKSKNASFVQTDIKFQKIFCPHRFYYACPDGIITKKDLPPYAGLYWISENRRLKMIKQAPRLHKMNYDITSILLHKFYHAYIDMRNKVQNYQFSLNEKMEGLNSGSVEHRHLGVKDLDLFKHSHENDF